MSWQDLAVCTVYTSTHVLQNPKNEPNHEAHKGICSLVSNTYAEKNSKLRKCEHYLNELVYFKRGQL